MKFIWTDIEEQILGLCVEQPRPPYIFEITLSASLRPIIGIVATGMSIVTRSTDAPVNLDAASNNNLASGTLP